MIVFVFLTLFVSGIIITLSAKPVISDKNIILLTAYCLYPVSYKDIQYGGSISYYRLFGRIGIGGGVLIGQGYMEKNINIGAQIGMLIRF